MKKVFLSLLVLLSSVFAFAEEAKEEAKEEAASVSVNAGVTYSSIYWWRGEVINYGAPVFFPEAGVSYGDISLSLLSGISQDWLTSENKNPDPNDETKISEKDAKILTEIDYVLAYSHEFEMFSIGAGIAYFQYPFFDEIDKEAKDPSFFEGSLSLTVNTLLSPTIDLYYDYYVEARLGEDGEEVPVSEDYYAKFSVSHDLISTEDGFALTLGAWAGYYNDPYYEVKGWSDAAGSLGFSKEYNGLTAASTFYYGRTLGKDFKLYNNGKKNHFWCDFGISYSM